MPGHCCVPFCNANYPTGPRVSVFSFPRDVELFQKWINAIPKKDFSPSANTKVCQKHFKTEDIITETSAYDTRRKVTITVPLKNFRLKSWAVPCIFEDSPVKQQKKVKNSSLKDNEGKDSVDSCVETSTQRKNAKSPSSVSDGTTPDKSGKHDDEKKETAKSPKKVSLTTDRPIITVIKIEDSISEKEQSPEKMDESNGFTNIEVSNQNSKSLSSPFKNLANVSVCLKEEDRIPVARELKGVKRSPSTGSSSSTGSSDVQKSLLMKRRKVEKPAPVVLGRQNDCYCWICHRENISLTCIACPRAYHFRCAGDWINVQVTGNTSDWVCPECQRILSAENVDSRSSTLAEISLDRLGALLKLSLNKMKQRAPIAFHQPVSLEHYPKYLHYVIHAMDFSLLEKNIKQKVYGCTEAFLADVKWISHNSCVFNGTQHPLSTNAKNLVKSCDQDMQEIEVCPDCFVHSVVRNKYWFSEVCRKPHPLVWAKLKGFPYWPAKVVRILDGNVDARFFGAHDRAWVPVSQCYHLSKEMPTTSKPKKKGNYEAALDELNVHVHFLIQKFGCFEYAPYRTSFNSEDKVLMYHGIDIDKISKEDITIDSNPQRELNLVNFEKENRFASFLESEYEKSSVEEIKLNENQSEIQSNHVLDKTGIKSPSFIIKQRISTESNFSEKEIPIDELKSSTDLKSVDKLKSNDESKAGDEVKPADGPKDSDEAKKIDSSLNAPEKKSSDSDQLRKLELALQRIKGYVSLSVDSEKENDVQVQNEAGERNDKTEENKKTSSELTEKVETEHSKVLSPLFKTPISLPVIEPSASQGAVKDVSLSLEATKKKDSFFLKLNETIESCKAKLGISEINDDDLSSDESGVDDNASRSDEDEDEETSASDAEEASEEDADEAESIEVSDDEAENDIKMDNAESDEESECQDSDSSDTDIENSNEASPKKIQKSINNNDTKDKAFKNIDGVSEDSIKSLNDSNEAVITNPDMQVPEVTIDASGALETGGENSISDSSNDIKQHSGVSLSEQVSKGRKSKNLISPQESGDNSVYDVLSNSSSEVSKDESSDKNSAQINSHSSYDFNVNKNASPFKNIVNNSSPIKKISSSRDSIDTKSEDVKSDMDDFVENKGAGSPSLSKNEAEEEENDDDDDDDDVLICTPTRPKSPPVIVLDDDQENENSSVSDTFAIKSPPYSTSIDSLSNEENPNCKSNSNDGPDNNHEKTIPVTSEISHEEVVTNDEKKEGNRNDNFDSKNSEESRKRKLSSDSSSDDEDVQVVTPVKKLALTGAIRTFHKPNNGVSSLKPTTPTVESVKRNLEKESLNQLNKSPVLTEGGSNDTEAKSPQSQFSRSQLSSPLSAERLLKSPIDTSNMTDREKEVFYLKSKLNCVLTAYQIQSWKCAQEREELRHNLNLVVMEMRACLESDKKHAIEALSKKFEQEKQKCVEDAKRKQWCACCLMESRYACCWNTSYCSIDCQKRHFPEHRHSCSQLKSRSEILELKQKSATSNAAENNESKKVIILNMKQKPPDMSQQVSVNKSQIQVKQPLQIATSTAISSNIQFVFAPVKSTAEASVTTSSTPALITSSSKECSLDSSQIINQVRNKNCDLGTAITLLKKKNMEAIITNVSKKEETEPKEANLEDIYFPSPPKITFEGYETATPDPNIVIDNEELKDESHIDPDDIELPNDASLEPDVVLSDTDDKDNEMINIGHGVEVKAKFLNKCLLYGLTAKKLTRCLVDVIFPDIKLLATCSAFGQKSNVTKLTRAALPSRKVHAIIDYVRKRFPDATRSEIVLQMNMKCKEARVILYKRENELTKKTLGRRLLAREKEGELATVAPTTTNVSSSGITSILAPVNFPTAVTVAASGSNIVPSVVCVKSTNSTLYSFNAPNKSPSVPNILRCKSQILIKPKPVLNAGNQPVLNTGNAAMLSTANQPVLSTVNQPVLTTVNQPVLTTVNQPVLTTVNQPAFSTVGKTAILQAPPSKKRETVRNLLAAKMNASVGNLSKDTRKFVMAVESKPLTSTTQPVSSSTATTTNMRPYIIIGSQINPVKTPLSTSTEQPALPVPSINK